MGVFNIAEAFDYNNAIRQLRSLAQDHPQVSKSTPLNPADTGFTITGTGVGVTYLSSGPSMFIGPWQLQCTLGGGDGVATFDVIEDFGGLAVNRGTLTAGARFRFTDGGEDTELIVRTTTNWVIADTIDFTTIAGALGAEAWTEDRFEEGGVAGGPPVPDVNGDFVTEWVANGPGISGTETINVGFQTNFDNATQRYNVGIEGADGFVGGSVFGAQPNGSPLKWILLNNQPMPCWFVVTGDYVTGMIRSAPGIYESFFGGFIQVFGTTGNHPRPLAIGGSSSRSDMLRTDLETGHTCFWDPAQQTASGEGSGLGSLVWRWVDGTWLDFRNRNTATGATSGPGKQFTPTRWVVPYKNGDGTYSDGIGPNSLSFDWSELSKRVVPRESGRYNLRPLEMFITNPQSALVGVIPAWKYLSGFGTNPEDTVEDTSPVFNGVVTQNVYRSLRDNFCALQLDV